MCLIFPKLLQAVPEDEAVITSRYLIISYRILEKCVEYSDDLARRRGLSAGGFDEVEKNFGELPFNAVETLACFFGLAGACPPVFVLQASSICGRA